MILQSEIEWHLWSRYSILKNPTTGIACVQVQMLQASSSCASSSPDRMMETLTELLETSKTRSLENAALNWVILNMCLKNMHHISALMRSIALWMQTFANQAALTGPVRTLSKLGTSLTHVWIVSNSVGELFSLSCESATELLRRLRVMRVCNLLPSFTSDVLSFTKAHDMLGGGQTLASTMMEPSERLTAT